MKRVLFVFISLLFAASSYAQEEPTANWPYLYPDFMEGELIRSGNKHSNALFNIHLNLSTLHYVDKKGLIKEADTWGVTGLVIGEDVFRYVGGKMMKVLAEAEGGCVVQETIANYSSIVRDDGAYGTTSLHSTTTKTFLYNENVINGYNGYLLTDVYKDLHAMKNQSETLPVRTSWYLLIGKELVPASKKGVMARDGIDRKALSAFLKAEKINWREPQDLLKVVEFITTESGNDKLN